MSHVPAVIARWVAQGIVRDDVDELAGGRAAAALDALARLRAIELPEAFCELWQRSDGTASMDDDEFSFWPLDNITSDPSLPPVTPPARELVFADWRLASVSFLLEFDAGRPGGVVALTDGAAPTRTRVADSFDAFLARYLAEPRALIVRPAR